jgi:MSHA biogenesis protein MshI
VFNWGKKKQATGRLALQVGRGTLTHAALSWNNGRPTLGSCADSGADAAAGKTWARFAHGSAPISVVLGMGDYQLLPIDAPPVPPPELKLAVRWRIKDQIDVPLDDVTVDVIRLGTGTAEPGNKLLAVIARNDLLRRYLALAEQGGLAVDAVDIPELAQRNVAALLETPGRALAVLSLTPDGGLLTVTQDGELCFHRRVQFDARSLTQGAEADIDVALQRLGLELQRSLDYIERHHGAWRLDRIVLAPPPAQPRVADFLRDHLYLPLDVADLGSRFDGVLPAPDALAACWFALGGALRPVDVDL